jgi:hypothetical protein
VSLGDVRDFVSQDADRLRFRPGGFHHTAIHPDGTARERERVDLPEIGGRKAVGIVRAGRMGRESLAQTLDVAPDLAVGQLRNLFSHLPLGFLTNPDFVFDRDERRDPSACHGQPEQHDGNRLEHVLTSPGWVHHRHRADRPDGQAAQRHRGIKIDARGQVPNWLFPTVA